MNDPNGPIFWKGKYHMFYQYNPNGAFWGTMHWGHAISSDMVHWRHLPVALAPTPGGPDADGCFSGTALINDSEVTVLYTGVVAAPEDRATIRDGAHSLQESQCLATSKDTELKTWVKHRVPAIAAPPVNMKVSGFRDPSPWNDGKRWFMTIGSGIPKKGGAVLLYRSEDLRDWEYVHIIASGEGDGKNTNNPVDSGDMWECPELFPLGGKHVLLYSTAGKVRWQSGELDERDMRFHPLQNGTLDYGAYYAAKTQLDNSGNRILWGWVPETRPLEQYRAAGWAGVMSLPRVLTLDDRGRVRMKMLPAVEMLRKEKQELTPGWNEAANQRRIGDMRITECCGEILCRTRRLSQPFSFSLFNPQEKENDAEKLSVQFDPANPEQVSIDKQVIPLAIVSPELEIQTYVDGSMIELIVNRQIAYLAVWQLSPISPNRLTVSAVFRTGL